MSKKITVLLSLALTGLAACGSLEVQTDSGFAGYTSRDVDTNFRETFRENYIEENQVGTVAYSVGIKKSSNTVLASTAYAANPNVGAVQKTGIATYTGQYGHVVAEDVREIVDSILARAGSVSGDITLTADFSAGTLKGSANRLSVNASIDGKQLNGSVDAKYSTYWSGQATSIPGTLKGEIGSTGAIASYHGNTDDKTMAGGFVLLVD